MKVLPLQDGMEASVVAWLTEKENAQWLDFGGARLSEISLRLMRQGDKHCLRFFTADGGTSPIGLVAFSEIHSEFRTARLWYVLGQKAFVGKGYTSRAVSGLLKFGFSELGLCSVSAWAVETNKPSIAVLRKNGFREIGRQRGCHYINSQPLDRLLFDLLPSEFRG